MKAWQSKEVEGVWRTGTVQCIPANVAVERAESVEVLVAIVDLIYQFIKKRQQKNGGQIVPHNYNLSNLNIEFTTVTYIVYRIALQTHLIGLKKTQYCPMNLHRISITKIIILFN